MLETAPDLMARPARPLNRWGLGTLAMLQCVLLAVSVIALNYLTARHYTRVDLSRTADYTLSRSTRRYLESDALASREHPVRWIMAFRRTSPFYERVRALAEEYARLPRETSNSKSSIPCAARSACRKSPRPTASPSCAT